MLRSALVLQRQAVSVAYRLPRSSRPSCTRRRRHVTDTVDDSTLLHSVRAVIPGDTASTMLSSVSVMRASPSPATEAITTCKAACEQHPRVAEPWLSQAGLHVAVEDYDESRRCLEEGLESVSDRWEKRALSMRLALFELLYGNRNVGIRVLNEVVAQDEYEVRARSLLLSLPEVQNDKAAAEKLIAGLKNAEGNAGHLWRLHQASCRQLRNVELPTQPGDDLQRAIIIVGEIVALGQGMIER